MCRYEASRPSLSHDLACGQPPAQQTPSPQHSHNFKIFCKIKQIEKIVRVATCKWRMDEISAKMRSVAEPANIIYSTGYVPLDPRLCRVRRIIQA